MSQVRFDLKGPVAVITIDRPGVRNAVDRATALELANSNFAKYGLVIAHDPAGVEFEFYPVLGLCGYFFGALAHFFHPHGTFG